jgi:hypothetical protein
MNMGGVGPWIFFCKYPCSIGISIIFVYNMFLMRASSCKCYMFHNKNKNISVKICRIAGQRKETSQTKDDLKTHGKGTTLNPEPEFVNFLRSPGIIDSNP